MPRRKKAAKAAGTLSKSDFIRQNPSLSAPEVSAKAKEAGLDIDPNTVHKIRSADKARAAKGGGRRGPGRPPGGGKRRGPGRPPGSGRARAAATGGGGLEQQFLSIVLDIGLSRASALLDRVREQARSISA